MNQHRVSKRKAEIPAGSGPGTTAILNKNVADIFADYPVPIRSKLLYLRQLVYETAAETEGVGAIEECVKWG